ncbi:MAG TPA: nuclear transport factor 2 family protein [Gaiellaceae bacterium]|nr:nuclear transport factor 2 family protein [Gaiellaceae bacterium]
MVTIKRSPELEEFAREGRRRFIAGDDAWFERTTAHGEVSSFGTDPDERSRGREEVLALTMEQINEMNTAEGLEVADAEEAEGDDVEAYEAGDAGWIVTHSRFTLDDGSWAGNRIITVVVRDHDCGGWKSVLTASQLLVPNELLLPGSPLLSPASGA